MLALLRPDTHWKGNSQEGQPNYHSCDAAEIYLSQPPHATKRNRENQTNRTGRDLKRNRADIREAHQDNEAVEHNRDE